jgi:anaerobic dimethyl sulfoxide reductase subunit B (iron-sulfur subunit)
MAVTQYAFYFDATACSGCKACQVACKDMHGLEVGRMWRRVFAVEGGEWWPDGDAWRTNVFAYNVSIACNHCELPICKGVCPTGAISKRDDGIVLIDESRCVGCGYCRWACPYDAPQLDPNKGVMTKCTFCVDEIDAGRPPTCVAACPMRVLDFGEKAELIEKYGEVMGVFPLPEASLTEPALVVSPHKDARRPYREPVRVSNREEV